MLSDHCYAVIMAGGAGTRLWPLSNRHRPKHFLKLFAGRSLIEMTVDRLSGQLPFDRILVLTNVKYEAAARETLPQIPAANFLCEPCLRDTAAAIGLAAIALRARCPGATMIVLTADQIIEPADRFNEAVAHAAVFLESHPDRLVAFGVDAAWPSTLVGWQKLGETVEFPGCEVRRIAAFTEKPPLETARQYMNEGVYCWNSGQFAWKAEAILREIAVHLPEAKPVLARIGEAWETDQRQRVLEELFPEMPTGSIDYKVMQKTHSACSIRLPCTWEDIGTHAALARKIGSEREADNLALGKTVIQGSENIVLSDTNQRVVLASDNLLVVVTNDTVLVADRNTDMKALLKRLSQEAPEVL